MLYLQFFVDEDRYVVAARDVVEIIPLVRMQRVPHAPEYVCGMAIYHGASLPVVDLCQRLAGRTCKQRLSTRIIVSNVQHGGHARRLGFMVEKMTGALHLDVQASLQAGVLNPGTPYLREVCVDEEGMAQIIALDEVLEEKDYEMLLGIEARAG